MRKSYNIKTILKLFEKKYSDVGGGGVPYPVIIFYGDGSGRIVENVLSEKVYAYHNLLFHFDDIDELIEHLQERP